MVTITRFVGLDIHQDSVQVCVMNAEAETLVNRRVPPDLPVFCGGVGETPTAPGEIAEVEKLLFDTGNQLARYCGLTPNNWSPSDGVPTKLLTTDVRTTGFLGKEKQTTVTARHFRLSQPWPGC